MLKNKIRLSEMGYRLFNQSVEICRAELLNYPIVHTQVCFPAETGEGTATIHLAQIIDELIEKFDIKKSPFDNRESEYFQFIKDTALDILRIKVSNDSPDHYIYISHQDSNNKVAFIIRDPDCFGITRVELGWDGENFAVSTIESLPSNPYTNPIAPLSL